MIQLQQIREALPSCVAVPYEQSDPTAHYSLHLRHPQHRALLRMLLRRSAQVKKPLVELFKFEERGDEILKMWAKSQQVGAPGYAIRKPIKVCLIGLEVLLRSSFDVSTCCADADFIHYFDETVGISDCFDRCEAAFEVPTEGWGPRFVTFFMNFHWFSMVFNGFKWPFNIISK